MGKEVERKFLVKGNAWKALARGGSYRQGYLNSVKERTVRLRTIDGKAFLTVKGITTGATRPNLSMRFPRRTPMRCSPTSGEKPLIEKIRYKVRAGSTPGRSMSLPSGKTGGSWWPRWS